MKSEIIRIMMPAEHFSYFQVTNWKILTTWFFIVQCTQIWCIAPWRWRQQASLKHWHLRIWLYSITSQKTVIFSVSYFFTDSWDKTTESQKPHQICKSCRFKNHYLEISVNYWWLLTMHMLNSSTSLP